MPHRIWGVAWKRGVDLLEVSLNQYLRLPDVYHKPVASLVKDLRIAVDNDPPDYFTAGVALMFSGSLVTTVRPFCQNAEFVEVPVEIVGKGPSAEPYYLANIMEWVTCLNEVNGDYTYWPNGTVDEIRKLAIDEGRAAGRDLFWVERAPPILLCASQAMQDAVRSAGHSGIGFRDIDKWKVISEWH